MKELTLLELRSGTQQPDVHHQGGDDQYPERDAADELHPHPGDIVIEPEAVQVANRIAHGWRRLLEPCEGALGGRYGSARARVKGLNAIAEAYLPDGRAVQHSQLDKTHRNAWRLLVCGAQHRGQGLRIIQALRQRWGGVIASRDHLEVAGPELVLADRLHYRIVRRRMRHYCMHVECLDQRPGDAEVEHDAEREKRGDAMKGSHE